MKLYQILLHPVDDCTMADEAHVVCTQHSGKLALVAPSGVSVWNLVAVQFLTPFPYQRATMEMRRAAPIRAGLHHPSRLSSPIQCKVQ